MIACSAGYSQKAEHDRVAGNGSPPFGRRSAFNMRTSKWRRNAITAYNREGIHETPLGTPTLCVLVRNRPEEAPMGYCKTLTVGGDPGGTHVGCFQSCTPCMFPADS